MKKIFYSLILSTLMFGACSASDDGAPQAPESPDGTQEPQEEPVTYIGIQKRSVKRGVSYSFQLPKEDTQILGSAISWAYNWGTEISSDLSTEFSKQQIDYCPMSWNANPDIVPKIRRYVNAHPECKYLLAYNEPNLTDQARMTPQEAAAQWPALRALATELNLKLISPAMNYGTLPDYSDPIKWLDEFFSNVPLSDVDGIAIHCYMENPSSLINYVNMFKKYGKPIWLTEFCAWPSSNKISISSQMNYMSETLHYLESDPDVFRYAWFIPRGIGPTDPSTGTTSNSLLPGKPNALTDLGTVFMNMSTLDKTAYYNKNQVIPAEHYSSINTVENLTSASAHLRPTTDISGILDVYDLKQEQWLEYQLNAPKAGTYQLDIRYTSFRDNKVEITIDKGTAATLDLPNVDSKWTTVTANIQLKAGKQTLRIKVTTGNIALNWLRFKD